MGQIIGLPSPFKSFGRSARFQGPEPFGEGIKAKGAWGVILRDTRGLPLAVYIRDRLDRAKGQIGEIIIPRNQTPDTIKAQTIA